MKGNLKRALGLFLLWISLLPLLAVAGDLPFGKGLLFLVEREGVAPNYLFGTMHSDDQRVLTLAPKVRDAFDRSERVALELKMDPATLFASAAALYFTDGRELRTVLGEERYQRLVDVMEPRGMPEIVLRRMKPWAVVVMLSVPESRSGEFLDMVLYRTAEAEGKELIGLESADEQLSLFDTLSEEEQITMLDETLKIVDKLPKFYKELLETYLQRDLAGLVELNEHYMEYGDNELNRRFMGRLVDDRNRRMVERLRPHLERGSLFTGVGALHLPGQEGILYLLEQEGYRVERMY
jgi:uncharacterized protein YbaP (TraB family)